MQENKDFIKTYALTSTLLLTAMCHNLSQCIISIAMFPFNFNNAALLLFTYTQTTINKGKLIRMNRVPEGVC